MTVCARVKGCKAADGAARCVARKGEGTGRSAQRGSRAGETRCASRGTREGARRHQTGRCQHTKAPHCRWPCNVMPWNRHTTTHPPPSSIISSVRVCRDNSVRMYRRLSVVMVTCFVVGVRVCGDTCALVSEKTRDVFYRPLVRVFCVRCARRSHLQSK